ncbi:peptidoglycan-binding protein [Cognatishimia sp. MH4019]|uniref:peptidoglycan-binding domain-containing protein n=1 Tax=Cognatishimia sp. MH4019 TaxID=2854030 RepID=UPI001CD308B8|nr:peptidoglycan-binding domain-containing protein [Cognatishimia sp. MH4019]
MTTTFKRYIGTVCATALLATGAVHAPQKASADNDFIKGLAVGIGGALIVNEANKANKKRQQQAKPKRKVVKKAPAGPRPTIATFPTTRDQVRDYQARLNSMGFNAGAPDGLYGGKTRTAVTQFQTSIGAAPTGKLTESDASILFQQSNQIATGLAAMGTAPAMPQNGLAPAPNAAGQIVAAPAPAFPTVGAVGQTAPAATPTFPASTAPAPGQLAAAPGTAFPTLGGTSQAEPAANPAFPTTGAVTPTAPAANAPAFPQVGGAPAGTLAAAPGAVAPTTTFPALGTAAVAGAAVATAPTFPSVAAPQPQDTGNAALALAAAPKVELPQQEIEKFSILGLATGQPLDDALSTLATEGYGSCETIGTITHCVTQAGSNQDIVSLHAMVMQDGSKQVAALSRRIEFGQQMPKAQLATMMSDRYANLLAAPSHMIATADCMGQTQLVQASASGLSEDIMSEDNPALAGLIDNCAHFSRIVFGENTGEATVDNLSIFLFDGGIFAASPNRPTGAAAIKF